jgi:hypothetical protein
VTQLQQLVNTTTSLQVHRQLRQAPVYSCCLGQVARPTCGNTQLMSAHTHGNRLLAGWRQCCPKQPTRSMQTPYTGVSMHIKCSLCRSFVTCKAPAQPARYVQSPHRAALCVQSPYAGIMLAHHTQTAQGAMQARTCT